jgi:hypothetical protein
VGECIVKVKELIWVCDERDAACVTKTVGSWEKRLLVDVVDAHIKELLVAKVSYLLFCLGMKDPGLVDEFLLLLPHGLFLIRLCTIVLALSIQVKAGE